VGEFDLAIGDRGAGRCSAGEVCRWLRIAVAATAPATAGQQCASDDGGGEGKAKPERS